MGFEATCAVSVSNLSRRFGDFIAVDGITFAVERGEVFGFLGPNGAGKSTTIRMLCGVLEPSGGEGTVAGFDVRSQRESIKANIGYMSQKFSLYEDLTVEENLDFFGGIYRISKGRRRERKEWALSVSGLEDRRKSLAGSLPLGFKQRLALGCAVLHEPPVLFLDEPTSGVDPISRRRFWELIYDLASAGVTVFVSTHYMDEAEYCQRLALIYAGRIIACNSPAGIKTTPGLPVLVEIVTPQTATAAAIAAAVPGVRRVKVSGQKMTMEVEDLTETSQAVKKSLVERGISIENFRRGIPTLEEVFVALVLAHDRAAQKPRETAV